MKNLALIPFVLLSLAVAASAQDIREAAREARADRAVAIAEAEAARERILADRGALTSTVDSLETLVASLELEYERLRRDAAAAERRRAEREVTWGREELDFQELSGNIRVAARDLESMLRGSPLSAGTPERLATVSAVLRVGYFPDLDDVAALADAALDEAERSGQVSVHEALYTGRNGTEVSGQVVHLGRFATIHRDDENLGFLLWNPEGQRLVAMPVPPARSVARRVEQYLDGESHRAPVDLSGGPALRELGARPSVLEQLRQGGPIVIPLGILALAAIVVMIWKAMHIERVHAKTDRVMTGVTEHAARSEWDACSDMVDDRTCRRSPVARVVRAGLNARDESREIQESVLQEAILHELPLLQRGLALLAVVGAVAPLLGLLGTVTGMIETFRVITLHGTGDPKLMSGGISEALVTTEIGLAIAIPVMLVHTLLKRRVDHVIGDMEEQAVHLVNTIERQRGVALDVR